METQKIKSHSKMKAILALAVAFSLLILISCIVLHITPAIMADSIFDFATHHYFLIGLISITVGAVCWKMYLSLDKTIEKRFQKKSLPSTRTRRKQILMFKKWWNSRTKNSEDESEFVESESIASIKFRKEDVLEGEEARQQRLRDLQKATVLGNSFKQKVILMFKDHKSRKHLMTTVWQISNEHVSLKGGVVIPVKSIYKIEF